MTSGPAIRTGASTDSDPSAAVDELYEAIHQDKASLVAFFCSPAYERSTLEAKVRERFGTGNVIGCTTAGEIGGLGYVERSISGFSLGEDFRVVVECMDGLRAFDFPSGQAVGRRAMARLREQGVTPSRANTFGFVLIDGLSIREESVASSLYSSLGDISMFGGSAGDALSFRETQIYHGGAFRSDRAVLALVSTSYPFTVFKTQHFVETGEKLVVTAADPERRIVHELNGGKAAREYASVVGVPFEDLGPAVFAEHPVVLRIGGSYFVRSIQKVNDDESLSFYCAIDEGIVLTLARGEDLVRNLEQTFESVATEVGEPVLTVGCDCVLRNLEVGQRGLRDVVSSLFRRHNVVGFSTYGEQYNAMHVNQTFTGVAIGRGR